jgi:LysM repeat protein
MFKIDSRTFNEIIELLVPYNATIQDRKILASTALHGCPVLNRIRFDGSTRDYVVNLVQTLLDYGECNLNQSALVALLEEVSRNSGVVQAKYIKDLIARVSQLKVEIPPIPISPITDEQAAKRIPASDFIILLTIGGIITLVVSMIFLVIYFGPIATSAPSTQTAIARETEAAQVSARTPAFHMTQTAIARETEAAQNNTQRACGPPPDWGLYTVQPGDTLLSIALRTNTPITELQEANCISNPNDIRVGQIIYVSTELDATRRAQMSETAIAATMEALENVTQMACHPPTDWVRYTVQFWDTLSSIAQMTNTSVEDLEEGNCFYINQITVGDMIFVPPDFAPTRAAQMHQTAIALAAQQTATSIPVATPPPDTQPNSIGDAKIFPFYDNEVNYPNTTTVELSIIFTSVHKTATPDSPVTSIPITPMVEFPTVVASGSLMLTPRPARDEFPVNNIPPVLMASLVCSPNSFTGCNDKTFEVEIGSDNHQRWILSPNEIAQGHQDLTLELYEANDRGERIGNPIWSDSFQIRVRQPNSGLVGILRENVSATVGGLATVLAALIGAGVIGVHRRNRIKKTKNNQPSIFISYRRSGGWAVARNIHDHLTTHGANVFLDVDDISEGRFEEYIKTNIHRCDYFVVILAPQTLESTWVQREIEQARQHSKTIIPIVIDGFDLYGAEVIDELKHLQSHNALFLTADNFNAIMDKLKRWTGLQADKTV